MRTCLGVCKTWLAWLISQDNTTANLLDEFKSNTEILKLYEALENYRETKVTQEVTLDNGSLIKIG